MGTEHISAARGEGTQPAPSIPVVPNTKPKQRPRERGNPRRNEGLLASSPFCPEHGSSHLRGGLSSSSLLDVTRIVQGTGTKPHKGTTAPAQTRSHFYGISAQRTRAPGLAVVLGDEQPHPSHPERKIQQIFWVLHSPPSGKCREDGEGSARKIQNIYKSPHLSPVLHSRSPLLQELLVERWHWGLRLPLVPSLVHQHLPVPRLHQWRCRGCCGHWHSPECYWEAALCRCGGHKKRPFRFSVPLRCLQDGSIKPLKPPDARDAASIVCFQTLPGRQG